jgi:hypothetical protein
MRRRMGAPSNHLESAGKSMARNIPTSDENYAALAANGSPRIPMGMSAYEVTAAPALQGTLMPKKNVQAGDPTNPGSKGPRRTPVLDAGGEKLGAAYVVKANYAPTVDPAAGATMANARIIPSVQGRVNPNFQGGEQTAYL